MVDKNNLEGKEAQKLLASLKRLELAIKNEKGFICSGCSQKKKIIFASVDKDWKEICLCQNCFNFKFLENTLGKDYLEKIKKAWEEKLQRFKLNPLSLAKYFYEKWKVSDPTIIQRLIYFTYLEILEKENVILFEEKFQAWPGGPVLESVIYPMYKNCEDLVSFFARVEEIEEWNIVVLQYLKNTAERYLNLKSSQIHREARSGPWEEVRQDLIDERESKPINESDLFILVQGNKKQPLSLIC